MKLKYYLITLYTFIFFLSSAQCPFVSAENWGGTGAGCACSWETEKEGEIIVHCAWGNCSTVNENSCVSTTECDGEYYHQISDPEELCRIILPVKLISFDVNEINGENILTWSTATELNNNYYIVSHSTDGEVWENLVQLSGNGTSNQVNNYKFYHNEPEKVVNYYKLIQVDFNGESASFGPVSVDNREVKRKIIKSLNIFGQEVDENYTGITIHYFSDGSVEKRWQ